MFANESSFEAMSISLGKANYGIVDDVDPAVEREIPTEEETIPLVMTLYGVRRWKAYEIQLTEAGLDTSFGLFASTVITGLPWNLATRSASLFRS